MKLLTDFPDYVVAVSASGQVDADDYEKILVPAINAVLQSQRRVRVLYDLTPEFTGFSAGAMWDDAKLGLAHWKAWERIAVVTDVDWVAHATRMFAFLMPGLIKVFSNAERTDAEKWIVG